MLPTNTHYNYKLVPMSFGVMLVLKGHQLGLVDEIDIEDRYVTFKHEGKVVWQNLVK